MLCFHQTLHSKFLCKLYQHKFIYSTGAVSYMWGMLESLRKLTSLSIISIKLPILTNTINKYLLQFSQMDVLPADKIEEYFLDFDDENDESLGQSFEAAGFDSINALRNLGSSFLYIFMSLMYCSLVFAAKLFISSRQVESYFQKFQVQVY
ncbi:hypothetical protein FGO68_gene15465 [Halteria grandinella]|uniref:Uncharacterized protein n=1 Tax=Halteria grandinella TaxID=5974 RepID=A0A8J8P7R5_HALGN|nr:hypothetical protein FGO68_gene15465 [Halteria grandinella]